MARGRTAARIAGGIFAGLFLLVAVAVALFTSTDWGRERVRAFGVGQIAGMVDGRVRIESLRGDLLSGAVLENIVIEDSTGAPFLRADTIAIRYSLRSFLARDLIFRDVRLVRPVIVLDQTSGGEWNFARLFPGDTAAAATTPAGDSARAGFGSLVRLEGVTLEDATVVVRMAWTPPDSLRDVRPAVVAASQPGWIVSVDGTWQRLAMVRDLHAELPLVRLADPDSAARVVEIESATMHAFPLQPPGIEVRELSGRIVASDDSVWVQEVAVALPESRVVADAAFEMASGGLEADVDLESLDFDDLAWLAQDLPDGGARGQIRVARGQRALSVAAQQLDVTIDSGRVAGNFDVQVGDTVRIGGADLRFDAIDTRSIERMAGPDVVPVDGVASGALRLAGTWDDLDVEGTAELRERSGAVSTLRADGNIGSSPDGVLFADALTLHLEPLQTSVARAFAPDLALRGAIRGRATLTGSTRSSFDIDADLTHEGGGSGRSRVLAEGVVELEETLNARDLQLRFAPLQVGLLESVAAELPVGGDIEGSATLNGSPSGRLHARLDVTHTDTTGTSRVEGTALWRSGGAFDLQLQLPALALATIGAFAPTAGLQGTASGDVRANGTTRRFAFATGLAFADSGALGLTGTVDLGGGQPAYDLHANMEALDLKTASARAPQTQLTGIIDVAGQGTDPALMNATVAADLVDTHLGAAAVDTSRIRMRVADGVAAVERAELRLASASADLQGTLGLVEGRSGELQYRLEVPHLAEFASYVPADTGTIAPRPVAQARRIAQARRDSLNTALATEVQRAATGLPAAPMLEVDSVHALGRDSVAGRIAAAGTLAGSIRRLSVEGTAEAEGIVAAGATVRSVRAEYTLRDFGTSEADAALQLAADSPNVAGFAFDSAGVDLHYVGVSDKGRGELEIELFQDPDRDYRLSSDFLLELDQREMTFSELIMRFDTTHWTSPGGGAVSWAGGGITLDSLLLLHEGGQGRIEVDGRVATEGESDLSVEIDNLPLGQIAALLQDTLTATGLLNLDADMAGTAAAPRLEGTLAIDEASMEQRTLPDLRVAFDYADRLLRADANLSDDTRPLLSARARLPVNLALSGVDGPRLLDGNLGIEAHADSLPLESLPSFTPAVEDVRGRIRGDVVVGGSWDAPVLNGGVSLDVASLRIVPAGVWLQDIAGAVELTGDAITVDSLLAYSGGGPIRVSGRVDVERLTDPRFDLRADADGAVIFDTDRGTIRTDAALTLVGPVDSASVKGEIHVREGAVVIPDFGGNKRVAALDDASVLPLTDSTEVSDEVLPTPNPLMRNLRLDLGLRVARDVWVRNSDANVEIYTPDDADPLRVRYNIDRPGFGLEGVINADRGEYEFAGRVFDLTTGAVSFLPTEALDPLLQLTANYEVARRGREALVIQIHVTGSLREPRVALESTAQPPLSESDLLSYLAFGRASSSVLSLDGGSLTSDGGSGGGIGALAQQQIASLALGTAVNDMFANLERTGGRAFDVFRVHPAALPDELAFASAFDNFLRGTEIVAGKYLTSGLYVAAEGRTTTETWPGLNLEYETTTGFTWRLTWEPRFLPVRPSFNFDEVARSTRVLGTFLYWSRRF